MYKTAKYFRLYKENQEYDLYLNETEATENISNCLHYKDNQKHLWQIKKDVKVIEGNIKNWGT